GSSLETLAQQEGFRHTFLNMADIGGRYSALSYFGILPAALMGLDIAGFLDHAETMVEAGATCVEPAENPGVWLGTIMGEAYLGGHDKVTISTSLDLDSVGLCAAQLIAERSG